MAYREPETAARTLRNLDRTLTSTRREAVRVEEIYQRWQMSQRTQRSTHHDLQLFIDQLPNRQRLRQEVLERDAHHGDAAPWWEIATKLGLMVTCDLLSEAHPTQPTSRSGEPQSSFEDGTVLYRQPLPATLTTWRLTRQSSPSRWAATEERTDWVLVTHPNDTRAIRLPLPSRSDTTVNVSFDESGALTSFTSDVTGREAERVQTLAALPSALRDASTAGQELASVFSPAAARLICFDLLALDRADYLSEPFARRRAALEQALAGVRAPVHLTPATTDRALAAEWLSRFEGAGLDGIIAKALDGVYEPDRRVWRKVKHTRTADCVVAGSRLHKRGTGLVGSLLLGLYTDDGELAMAG